jgi:hypothetical protein
MRPLCILLLTVVVGTTTAAPGHSSAPSAEAVLQSMLQGHERLGPALIRGEIIFSAPGRDPEVATIRIKRNDPTHFTVTGRGGRNPIDVYADGHIKVTHYVERGEYRRDTSIADDIGIISLVLRDVKAGLQEPETRARLRAGAVREGVLDGEQVYRISWKEPPFPRPENGQPALGVARTPISLLVVRQSDGLLRQVTAQDAGGVTWTQRSIYELRARPFPSDAFRFKPPPGAVDVTTPAPQNGGAGVRA